MFVSFEKFCEDGWNSEYMSEEEYTRLAPVADAVVDDITLGRASRELNEGYELPKSIEILYYLVMKNLPVYTNVQQGSEVASFSNGIDSYSFVTGKTYADQMKSILGWYIDALPIEWVSVVVNYHGGEHEG